MLLKTQSLVTQKHSNKVNLTTVVCLRRGRDSECDIDNLFVLILNVIFNSRKLLGLNGSFNCLGCIGPIEVDDICV